RDRCTISCRPVGFSFYARIVSGVPDGGLCHASSDHICVNGLCKKIGCDNIVGSGKILDRCGVCGGRNESCNIMKGFYTPPNLPTGYNTILSLPKGACNINITETTASRNLLALKSSDGVYILNGHWQRNSPGLYKFSGTSINYKEYLGKKCAGECIYVKGPTKSTLILELLVYDRNPGIFYEYSIPTGMVPKILDKMKSDVPSKSQQRGKQSHRNPHHPDPPHHPNHPQPHPHPQPHRQPGTKEKDYLNTNHHGNSRNIDRHSGPYYIPSFDSNQALGAASDSRTAGHKWNSNPRGASYRGRPYPYRNHNNPRIIPSRVTNSTVQSQDRYRSPYLRRPTNNNYGSRYAAYRTANNKQYYSASKFYNNNKHSNNNNHHINNYNNHHIKNDHNNHTRYGYQKHRVEPRKQHSSSKSHLNNVPTSRNTNTGTSDQLGVTYQWHFVGFTECTETCGGGTQSTKVVCVKTNTNTIVTDSNCDANTKLKSQTTACNTSPCSARWTPDKWSECSVSCGDGQMTRTVECKQRFSESFVKRVSASACLNQTRLATVQKCHNKPCSQWKIKEWTKCSVECGLGQRSRDVKCVSADDQVIPDFKCRNTKPAATEVCDMGSCAKSWFFTEWSKECSASCGHGVIRRKVHCSAEDGSSLVDSKCKLSEKPRSEKSCKSDQPCGGLWFTGPWSKCSAACGQSFKVRNVVCVKKLHSTSFVVVNPKNCLKEDKPVTEQPCLTVPECPPQWHMSEWSKCSVSCGTGSQSRDVKCMDNLMRHSSLCDPGTRPETRQSCNSESCHNKPLNTDPSCHDQMKLCRLVVQARLCTYKYYQRKCCDTCYKHRINHIHRHSS
ncbi:ADAMTS-like protein 4 isoform X1, partial [Argonauta hians]